MACPHSSKRQSTSQNCSLCLEEIPHHVRLLGHLIEVDGTVVGQLDYRPYTDQRVPGPRRCGRCGQPGHRRDSCDSEPHVVRAFELSFAGVEIDSGEATAPSDAPQTDYSKSAARIRGPSCFECGERGHYTDYCPVRLERIRNS